MACSWDKVPLGATGLAVTPVGLGASYGLSAPDVRAAIERGINYIYWGSYRRPSYAQAIREVGSSGRDGLVIAVQSYTRAASVLRRSLHGALRKLKTDRADVLLLGWWNMTPPARIIEAAVRLREQGLVRALMVSCHHRPTFERYIDDARYDALMVRYNAAHVGAEREVFPHLARRRPGVVSYTATRWGTLLDPAWMPRGEATPRASDCYRFALANPAVDVVLSGPADRAQLDEAMAALDRGPMSADELAWMRRVGTAVRDKSKQEPTDQVRSLGDRLIDVVSRLAGGGKEIPAGPG